MQPLHSTLGSIVMAAAALFALGAGVAAWLDRGHLAVRRTGLVLGALLVIQVAVGALIYAGGTRPGEGLHLLYGIAILAVLPLASSFASDAPERSRSGVLGGAAIVLLLLAWRLLSTG